MLQCPYCGCDSLVKNGSTRGIPKWKCKTCGRQTSLRGGRAADAEARDSKRAEAILLYLCGLSFNVIAFLKAVAPSTILNWVRHGARRWAAKPQPRSEGVIVMELDEVWHFRRSLALHRTQGLQALDLASLLSGHGPLGGLAMWPSRPANFGPATGAFGSLERAAVLYRLLRLL